MYPFSSLFIGISLETRLSILRTSKFISLSVPFSSGSVLKQGDFLDYPLPWGSPFSSLFIGISLETILAQMEYERAKLTFSSLFIGISLETPQHNGYQLGCQSLSVPFSSGSVLKLPKVVRLHSDRTRLSVPFSSGSVLKLPLM